jgi:membrane associated rhomboid family serine protease
MISYLAIFSVGCEILEPLANWIGFSLFDLFALSLSGVSQGCFWQPLTSLFIFLSPGGLSFSFLFEVFLQASLLWIFAPQVIESLGKKAFLTLYIGSGVLANLLSLMVLFSTGSAQYVYGPYPASFALLMFWTILNPKADLFLLFLFPLKAKTLILGLIGANFLVDLSQGLFLPLFRNMSGVIFAYLAATLYYNLQSPFPQLQRIDNLLLNLKHLLRWKKRSPAKIFDISSGEALNDDEEFLDAMLNKISKEGESSLTRQEKLRMQKISAARKGKNAS